MKYCLKYSLLLLMFGLMSSSIYAKKNTKKQKTTQSSKKSTKKKTSKKAKKKNNNIAKVKRGKKPSVASYNEAAYLNTISKNASANFTPQKVDSIPEKVVTILSAFKPQLKNLAKVNFSNASAQTDTTTVQLNYQVPSQNLSFRYKPITLIPRSYKVDSLKPLMNSTNVKVGFGNYNHYYIGLNTSFQDVYKNYHSFDLMNESIDGEHPLQGLKEIGFKYIGDINVNNNNKLYTQIYFKQSKRNRFGLVEDTSNFPIDNYKQNYYLTGFNVSWQNLKARKIQYQPAITIEHFEGYAGATNNWVALSSPMFTKMKNGILFHFDFNYTLNLYNPIGLANQSLSVIRLDPYLEFDKLNSHFKIGVSPASTPEGFNLFPIIEFKKQLKDTNYYLTAGWNTILTNQNYANLVQVNPWLTMPKTLNVTTRDRKFVNVHINANKRLNYGIGLSINEYKNLPLFTRVISNNNATQGLFYQPIFESKANTIEVDAYLNYQFSDHLQINNKLNYIQFNGIKDNVKPWGILPIEFNSKLSWLPNKKWVVDGGVQYWSGSTQQDASSLPVDVKGAFLLNAGFSYKLTKNWSVWAKGDNLFNKPVQRWSEYPSLGVQLIAGVVYSFRK